MSAKARSSISGPVHGSATQFGTVHGDVHLSTSPGVSWPVHVGVVPRRADCYQDRPASPLTGLTVLRGMGGVGKTQTAAHHARTAHQDPDVDLVVWITATSREAVVAGYAEAAALLQISTSDADTTAAAAQVLSWLRTTPRRWLIVLDDLADPSVMRDLWPPTTETGQILVTTRRKDSALARAETSLVDITVFTPEQSQAYLDAKLAARADLSEGAPELAQVLGHLPLALAQAVAYLTDRGLTCAAYVARFRDQRRKLGALVPEPSALPDDHQATIDVTWSLSIELANSLAPAGLARPMLQIASLLDPNGIPVALLTSPPVTARLAEISGHDVDAETATDALHCLHRLSLTEPSADAIAVHALVQRATRDDLTAEDLPATAQTAADALHSLWPDHDGNAPLLSSLRANTSALTAVALSELIGPDCHPLLFAYGESLGRDGLMTEAHRHYERLFDLAMPRVGGDAPDILAIRNSMTIWRGQAGDAVGSVEKFGRLIDDCIRVLGANHPLTLSSRSNRASCRLTSGDNDGAAKDFEDLLVDQSRVLGLDARETMITRGYLAHCRFGSGDLAAAAHDFEQLLSDQISVLGKDHQDVLETRHNLASCKSAGIDTTGAVADYEALLADQIRVLGAEHRSTLTTRMSLAGSRGSAGDVPAAVRELRELLEDLCRIRGPVHPDTLLARGSLARWRATGGEVKASLEDQALVLHDCLQVLGPLHQITFATRSGLAGLHRTAGDPLSAVRHLEELVTDQTAALGANHLDTLSTRNHLARSWADAGDFKRAITEFKALAKDYAEVVGADHLQTLTIRLNLARLHGVASQFTKAIRVCEPLLRDQVRVLGPEHDDTLETRQLLANLRYQTGDAEGAIKELEQLLAALSRMFMPTHDRITKVKREIEFLKKAT